MRGRIALSAFALVLLSWGSSEAARSNVRGKAAAIQPPEEAVVVSWSASASNGLSLRPSNDPAAGSLLTWWNGFSGATVTEGPAGTTFTQNPHTATLPPGPATPLSYPGTLDYVKHLAFTAPFKANATNKLAFTVRMSSQTTLPAELPYKVTNPRDDVRLGACSMNFIDFSTMMVADIFLTNKGIWALYERLPFARTEGHVYASFTTVKRIGTRSSPSQVHELTTKYDQATNTLEWWVDGVRKLKISKLGRRAANMRPLVDRGGVEEEVALPSLVAGFGCFTLLDGADPNAAASKPKVGLLNLNPTSPSSPDEVYQIPSAWQVDTRTNSSAVGDASWRLFGQGTSVTLSAFKVAYE